MSNSDSQGNSLDDELAAAFDGEFGEDDEQGQAEHGGIKLANDDGEGGNSASSSDVDLDDLGDKGFTEIETLQEEGGFEVPPAKRQRVVRFRSAETFGPSGSKACNSSHSSGRGSGAAAAAGACAHPVWVFGLCGVCGISKEAAAAAAITADDDMDQYGQYMSCGAGGRGSIDSSGGRGGGSLRSSASAVGSGGAPQAGILRLKHLHANMEVEVSNDEAERIRRDTVSRLLNRKRLILILDLDHTLLNSVHVGEISEDTAPQLSKVLKHEEEANLGPKRLLHRLAENKLWTKLRPGVFEFLEGLRDAYEMHIYTMGDKTYAAEIRKLLDPTGRLFASVIAKDHSTTTTAKDLDVLLSADELALVLDDTEVVWPGHRRNLLQIERYHYFPSDIRKWRVDGTALLEQGIDESSTRGALATHMRVLRAVHTRFFSEDDPSLPPLEHRDVRDILAEQRRKTLQGCFITFSRCWPQDRNPRREPLWQLAEALGASCLPDYDPRVTTHVVAAVGGTEKVHLALSQGKEVVLPTWLQGCSYTWERLPEGAYQVRRHSSDGRSPATATAMHGQMGSDAAGGGGRPSHGGSSGKGCGSGKPTPEDELQLVLKVAGGGGGSGGGGGGG
ncbi:hypothetical protein Vretimale_10976 [Volvox reticuliferus]|uniref:RNA polymerase II C-terminal domain phosphatase-like n=1 Tax=Volvox reticuliferus TaxID=1737510 RepID=A0A8J4FNT4_9CHLO|nr:hypothetical protein Vretifemale_12711 [Volvox reticuliferus]GIM06714.1 hypothetical protein Vretimale_10976 [Volvox reticuliferus]